MLGGLTVIAPFVVWGVRRPSQPPARGIYITAPSLPQTSWRFPHSPILTLSSAFKLRSHLLPSNNMTSVKELAASKTTVVGESLASVLPRSPTSWVGVPHLLRLNILLLLVLCSSMTLGFDASMMGGLLSLETWNSYFGTPRSSLLGLMNAVLPLGVVRII